MVKYTETATYKTRLVKLESDISDLDDIIKEISRIKLRGGEVKRKRTPEEERRLTNAKSRKKTLVKRLRDWTSMTMTPWNIAHLIQASDGTLWTERQYELWHKDLASHEGRGEASLRDHYGLPEAVPTTGEVDIPENGVEAKNVQGRSKNGTLQLQTIQAGKSGRQAYSVWMGQSSEDGHFKGLPSDVRLALFTGEVSRNIIYGHLPDHIRDSLLAAIRPSTIFNQPKSIDCTTRNGFLHIDRSDFDAAWDIVCITKCGPKYALKKGYLLERLKRTLSVTDDSSNVAA